MAYFHEEPVLVGGRGPAFLRKRFAADYHQSLTAKGGVETDSTS